MLKVLIIPPFGQEVSRYFLRHFWFVSIKQDSGGAFGQSGILMGYVCKPTQRQIRQAKKLAKAAFQDYLNSCEVA